MTSLPAGDGKTGAYPFLQCVTELLNRIAPTCVVGGIGAAVVGRLGHHVREVDSLAEHVAGHRGFGGRNPQTLQITDVKLSR